MITGESVFRDRYGLHPRAAHRIISTVGAFAARVTLEDLDAGGAQVDARSMLGLVSAGIRTGDRVLVTADGADESAALAAVRTLLDAGVCHP